MRRSFVNRFKNLKIKYKKDPKKFIAFGSSFVVLVSLLFGSSYAYLTYISKTNNTTSITAGTLALTLQNEANVISLDKVVPVTDQEGLSSDSEYSFSIKNNGTIPASYKLKLGNNCVVGGSYEIGSNNVTANKCIPLDYIKVGIKKGNGEYKILENKDNGFVLDAGNLQPNGSDNYKMKVWLDYDTPNDYNASSGLNSLFVGKLNLEYEQGFINNAIKTLIAKVGESGLTKITHAADSTLQIGATSPIEEYRYVGPNSTVTNNYVNFNNDTYRIIGIFPTDDGTGNIENRVKLIKEESIGDMYWNSNNTNNWAEATLNTYLNGTFYNSLDTTSKSLVGNAKYYLGGYNDSLFITKDVMYTYERKTSGSSYYYGSNPTNWTGKIALMYASDYGYGASSACTQTLDDYDNSSCYTNDWLNLGSTEWILPQNAYDSYRAFRTGIDGGVYRFRVEGLQFAVRPVLYLVSGAQITGGDGSSGNPYTFGL